MMKRSELLPQWLLRYDRADLRDDITAGLTIAVMLVPQGMAYAMLAGLPPVIGLYASTLPLIAYALFGSSRQLAVGPVAMISLLVFAACSRMAPPGSPEYIATVLLLAFTVGALQVAAGLLRLGFLVNFFSHTVISGFTSAAAIVIALSQMKHLLGIKLGNEHLVLKLLVDVMRHLGETNLPTLAIGLTSVAILYLFRRKWPRLPGPIVCVVAGTLAVYALGLARMGVKTVGDVPGGLPSFSLPAFRWDSVRNLMPTALVIFFVGYMESISVAKYVAARRGYKVDANRELVGLGAANMVASFFSGYPVTGGFSRSAVNYQAGARTQLAAIVTAVAIIVTLLLLTPLFYHLPNAVLGAIVVVAVIGLIDYRGAIRLFKLKKADGWTFVLTFVGTLTLGIDLGILVAVIFSLALFIWRSSHPHTAELGYLEGEDVFRNLERYPQARTYPGVLILRVDASLYFANAKFLEDWLERSIAARPNLQWVVVDMSGVNDIDAPAVDVLEHTVDLYGQRGIRFAFAGMKGSVRDLIGRAGWNEKYGGHCRYLSIPHALRHVGPWAVPVGGSQTTKEDNGAS